ncbi:hypothetical protein Q8A67_000027 [Cirrhinus molitorella]|uniref:Uncharacterized protein n=1 Tax=Cirrhinus molitorella TaxID=172907 RepID=A0AA88TXC2_9TELE|nr:hypothetical protein Q8A67_000027 [Cirrhinus molitorella]
MTFIVIFIWTLLYCFILQGCEAQITVTQTPSVKPATPGENVVMSCKLSSATPCGSSTPYKVLCIFPGCFAEAQDAAATVASVPLALCTGLNPLSDL